MSDQFDPTKHPRGDGGKFTPTSTGEMEFINDYSRGAEGTFEFPPAFRNYDQLKEFYLEHHPSQETLRDFSAALREHWGEINRAEIRRWEEHNPNADQVTAQKAARDIINRSNVPSSPQIEPLCRIKAMAEAATTLTPFENNRFWDDEFAIAGKRGGQAEIKTGEQFYDDYHLSQADVDEYRYQRVEMERQQNRMLADQNKQMAEQTTLLRELLSDSRVRERNLLLDKLGPR